MNQWQLKLQAKLEQRQQQQLLRTRLTSQGPQGVELKLAAGQSYLNFSSNDYLGLANHPAMVESLNKASKQFGVGSGASHLVVGHSEQHHQLEQELAEFVGYPRALLFSNGFMANLGVLTGLFDKSDLLLQDKLNHASLLDGGLASKAKMVRYQHNDMDSLSRQLSANSVHSSAEQQPMIVTDSVFSMDGDQAPLQQIVAQSKAHQANLMIDDAHGFGVLGEQGRGSLSEQAIDNNDCAIFMATLGKALGGFGAFVAGSDVLIESLIQYSRSYIYTTAMPPALAAANRTGLQLIQKEAWRIAQLRDNISYFTQLASDCGLPLMPSSTAIQPILIGDNHKVMAISAALRQQNIIVAAIRPPTVAKGSARLRVTLSALHSKQQIERLVDVLHSLSLGIAQQETN